MGDTLSSCSGFETSYLEGLCSNSSANDTNCKNKDTFVFLLKANCYITEVFYPLTGLLIVIGTILNLFSLYCFLKTNKRSSQNVYLSVLSLADTINLHINFALPMLRQYERFDNSFRNLQFLCRFTGVLTEFFLIFPAWIIVLLTVERLLCMLWPLKRRASFTQTRAKISIIILAIIVLVLSLYRLSDLKGIDQISVFSVVTCNRTDEPNPSMRNLNLMIWTIVPECLTLIMSLIIIYKIKLATKHIDPNCSKAHQLRYNQATKIVLLISILFLVFHTPTGIMIALNIFFGDGQTLGIITILVSRKLTIILYEISLCCKFLIYHQTFQNFKIIIRKSIFHFIRRANSAKLGRPDLKNLHAFPQRGTIHFGPPKRSITSPGSQSDLFMKSAEEHQNTINNRHQRTGSTSISRTHREHQPLSVVMTKTNADTSVSLLRTSDITRCTRGKRQSLWSTRAQVTL